jgi:hypothetical protein
MTTSLRISESLIMNWDAGNANDGIARWKDCEHGRYLITMDMDHFELTGLNPESDAYEVAKVVSDNLKINELQKDEQTAHKHGYSHVEQTLEM